MAHGEPRSFPCGARRQSLKRASPPTLGRGNRRQRLVPPSISILQCRDDEIASDGVAYALLSGETQASLAIGIGYIPIGGERTVTHCQRIGCFRERPSLSAARQLGYPPLFLYQTCSRPAR